ncbi:MAG: LysR family transcriptional regulator [Achromobacter sp.]|uniref:LysR family transcriptional regulator n=1 Tax=Achromobacter sp. TaxID=134375 RepID=UPI0029A3FC4B|nr:LysR family transcriptional regulator [Achromobacter sp.]MDX3985715.1 LysR family transcriptional regulator [Achromobacter sp.]
MKYFLIVAEELSFVRAAARVHIEPSPLSRTIKELENQLGVQLLHRSKGRIRLTWPGEVFREEARRIIAVIDSAKTKVISAAQGFHGRLRIGLADSLAPPRLTMLLARYREEEPRTEVRIVEMTVTEMLNGLSHGVIDIGFTVDHTSLPGFVKDPIWADRPAIVIPKNHPLLSFETIPISEALRYPLILCHPERCAGGYNAIRRLFGDPALPSLSVAEYASSHESMMMLVAAGYGIGIGLETQIALYRNPNVVVREMGDGVPSSVTYAVTMREERSRELEGFINRAIAIGEIPRPAGLVTL